MKIHDKRSELTDARDGGGVGLTGQVRRVGLHFENAVEDAETYSD